MFEELEEEHVSKTTRQVVAGLLEKDPLRRLTLDNVLNHTFKGASKDTFVESHRRFKRTVVHMNEQLNVEMEARTVAIEKFILQTYGNDIGKIVMYYFNIMERRQ